MPARSEKAKEEEVERDWRVRAIPEREGIKIGNSFASKEEVVAALANLSGPVHELDIQSPSAETVTIRVTADEKQRLKNACTRRGLPEWHLAREALKAVGLI